MLGYFFTYVLLSNIDNKFYIGYTPDDVFNRLKKHNNGDVPSTKPRKPFCLIYYEAFLNKKDALRRERYFKTSKGRITLKQMLKEYFNNQIRQGPPKTRA